MKRNRGFWIVGLAVIAAGPAAAQRERGQGDLETGGLEEAYDETSYIFDWRVRYEVVDQAGFEARANALTSRVRAGFQSGPIARTRLLAEMVGTSELSNEFNSTTNGQARYPVAADPGGFAAINRFALINESLDKTKLTLGRQRLILDDARFIGNVGWRQNEQTFDGLLSQTAGEKFQADFAWFNQVNRIFGPESPNGEWNGDVVLLRGSRSFRFGRLTAFAYGMEFDEAPAASSETLGLTLAGSKAFGDTSLIYTLSAASQRNTGLNPVDYSESYRKIEGGVSRGQLTLALGAEVLAGDGAGAFATPLATLHAFQGWADQFLATPANGVEDRYLRLVYRANVSGPFESIDLAAAYHDLAADTGAASYGDELDLSIAAGTGRVTLTLKYAAYEAESLFSDTDKLWLSMDYVF